jgi:hypothetical protein
MIKRRVFFKLSALHTVGVLVACVPLTNEINPTFTKVMGAEAPTKTPTPQPTVETTKTATQEATATKEDEEYNKNVVVHGGKGGPEVTYRKPWLTLKAGCS